MQYSSILAPTGTVVHYDGNHKSDFGNAIAAGDYLLGEGEFRTSASRPISYLLHLDGSYINGDGQEDYVLNDGLSLVEDDVIRVGDTVERVETRDEYGNVLGDSDMHGCRYTVTGVTRDRVRGTITFSPVGVWRSVGQIISFRPERVRKVAAGATAPTQSVSDFLKQTSTEALNQARRRGNSTNITEVGNTLIEWALMDNTDIDTAKANLVKVFLAANKNYGWCPEGEYAMEAMGFKDLLTTDVVVEVVTRVTVSRTPGMHDADVRDAARRMIPTGVNHDLVSVTIL